MSAIIKISSALPAWACVTDDKKGSAMIRRVLDWLIWRALVLLAQAVNG